MSIQIQPQQVFAIVRQLPDPSDTATYYVRAEIRNAQTDAIINIGANTYLNLTDKGSRRFIATFQAPADISGRGLLISIRTTVYTDSGYTTQSTTYNEEIETYLVMERFNPRDMLKIMGPAFGDGGGPDINYKKIREIFTEELSKSTTVILKRLVSIEEYCDDSIKTGSTEMIRVKSMITSSINELQKSIASIDIKPVEFDNVISEIKNGVSSIMTKIQKMEDDDKDDNKEELLLNNIIKTLELIKESNIVNKETYDELNESFVNVKTLIGDKLPQVQDAIDNLSKRVQDIFLYSVAIETAKNQKDPEIIKNRAKELANLSK
jgi:hypothetical protein